MVLADLKAGNGIVHAIDAVLMPPSATRTVVGVATGSSDFTTLVSFVSDAGLVGFLSTDTETSEPFTIFAPTNVAFEKLPKRVLRLLSREVNRDALVELLQYHVVAGVNTAASLSDGDTFETLLQGESLIFSVSEGMAMINNANVTATDLLATNGVVHVIDSVLQPSEQFLNSLTPTILGEVAKAVVQVTMVIQGDLSAGGITESAQEELRDIIANLIGVLKQYVRVLGVRNRSQRRLLAVAVDYEVLAESEEDAQQLKVILQESTGQVNQAMASSREWQAASVSSTEANVRVEDVPAPSVTPSESLPAPTQSETKGNATLSYVLTSIGGLAVVSLALLAIRQRYRYQRRTGEASNSGSLQAKAEEFDNSYIKSAAAHDSKITTVKRGSAVCVIMPPAHAATSDDPAVSYEPEEDGITREEYHDVKEGAAAKRRMPSQGSWISRENDVDRDDEENVPVDIEKKIMRESDAKASVGVLHGEGVESGIRYKRLAIETGKVAAMIQEDVVEEISCDVGYADTEEPWRIGLALRAVEASASTLDVRRNSGVAVAFTTMRNNIHGHAPARAQRSVLDSRQLFGESGSEVSDPWTCTDMMEPNEVPNQIETDLGPPSPIPSVASLADPEQVDTEVRSPLATPPSTAPANPQADRWIKTPLVTSRRPAYDMELDESADEEAELIDTGRRSVTPEPRDFDDFAAPAETVAERPSAGESSPTVRRRRSSVMMVAARLNDA